MTTFERKQYQTIILAGLLHDIGKFMQRVVGENRFAGEHANLGAMFVNGEGPFAQDGSKSELHHFSQQIKTEWVDKDEFAKAIKIHHRGSGICGTIVHKADSYSTKERFEPDQGVKTYPPRGKMTALGSVFTHVKLHSDTPRPAFGYHARILDAFESIPVAGKEKLEAEEADALFMAFATELASLRSNASTFDHFFQSLCSTLEKYVWCLPCHTHPAVADVSIFDHLRSTSAIAACLYHFHCATNTLAPAHIRADNPAKFILVGGSLSGIQNYIYHIASITGEGGVAKRLRARSFFISALVETTVTRLLHSLDLPSVCNLVSAGGRFIILAPNATVTQSILEQQAIEINQWLLDTFSGELSLNMDWRQTLTGDDFYRAHWKDTPHGEEEENPDQFRKCNYRDRLDGLRWGLEQTKQKCFQSIFIKGNEWNESVFVRRGDYNAYADGRSDCNSCRKFPAVLPDPHEADQSDDKSILCTKCFTDKILGRLLLDATYLIIGKAKTPGKLSSNSKRFYFYGDHYYFQPAADLSEAGELPEDHEILVIQRLRDHYHENELVSPGIVHRFMANYAPFFDADNTGTICRRCKNNSACETKPRLNRLSGMRRELMTFECLAAAGCEWIPDSGKIKGAALLGILKADVDNLGLIFSRGLKNRVTLSRYLTLSRMIDLFFSGWVYRILKESKSYRHIYTVYSGGDDLVLVGPWEAILEFSAQLNRDFRAFTCDNPDISLSAGIAIVHPRHPISDAVAQADLNLQRSKLGGKDRLTVFDTTVDWRDFPSLKETMRTLDKAYQQFPGILTTRFLHRLLIYHNMFLNAQNGRICDLIFLSRMHADVKRNLIERIDAHERANSRDPVVQEHIRWFRQKIIEGVMQTIQRCSVDPFLMRNLKIPLFWTLYRNRDYLRREVKE